MYALFNICFFKLFIHLSFDFQYIIAEFFLLLVEIIIFIFFTFLIRMVRLYKLHLISTCRWAFIENIIFVSIFFSLLFFFSLQLYCCIMGKDSYYCHLSKTDNADKVFFYLCIYRYFQNGVYHVKRLHNRSL